MKYRGSCLCGKVAFEVEGEFESLYLCHCERCRKDTGSAHAANLFSSTATLHWLSGQELANTYNFNETGHIKSFCAECGSALPNIQMGGGLLVVPAGSLDDDIPIPAAAAHIFVSRRAGWDEGLERLPVFDELPE